MLTVTACLFAATSALATQIEVAHYSIHTGDYTVYVSTGYTPFSWGIGFEDIGTGDQMHMTAGSGPGSGSVSVSGRFDDVPGGPASPGRSEELWMSLQFQADAGKSFDTFTFAAMSEGFLGSNTTARTTWSLGSGSYVSGPLAGGYVDGTALYRLWGVDPATRSGHTNFYYYDGSGNHPSVGFEQNSLFPGTVFEIGASSFTLDIDLEEVSHDGSRMVPNGLGFDFTLVDAPQGVPDSGSTLVLLGLGILGISARCRRWVG